MISINNFITILESRQRMFTAKERTSLISLGLPTIFLRFGKAIVYLIFIFYALTFTDNKFLIGIAFGITALVQAILTIPFGFWSDKFGRKKIISIGLIMFIIGSFLAAHPFGNIYILIFARFLQGISAIYSCVLAFISDIIPDSKRSRTMALFSIFTGIVFSLGIILGPTLSPMFISYSTLFVLSGILAIIALICLLLFVPEPKHLTEKSEKISDSTLFKDVLKNNNLMITFGCTFAVNFVIVSILFVYVPLTLDKYMSNSYIGLTLIPIFLIGMFVMFFTSKLADKGKRISIMFSAFIIVVFGMIFLFIADLIIIIIGLVLFFMGMAIIDPILPSLVITIANEKSKGTASGFYNVSRYLGESFGAMVAGFFLIFTLDYLLTLLIVIIIILIFIVNRIKVTTKSG